MSRTADALIALGDAETPALLPKIVLLAIAERPPDTPDAVLPVAAQAETARPFCETAATRAM